MKVICLKNYTIPVRYIEAIEIKDAKDFIEDKIVDVYYLYIHTGAITVRVDYNDKKSRNRDFARFTDELNNFPEQKDVK